MCTFKFNGIEFITLHITVHCVFVYLLIASITLYNYGFHLFPPSKISSNRIMIYHDQ